MTAPTKPVSLRTSGLETPLTVAGAVEFSWRFDGEQQPVNAQVGLAEIGGGPFWSAAWTPGTVPAVRYDGPGLRPGVRYAWTVTVIASATAESCTAEFEVGIGDLAASAEWIGLPVAETLDDPTPVHYLRRLFTLEAAIVHARLYVASLGWHGIWLNGVEVGGLSISPRYTALDQRVEFETYDVTEFLRQGDNALGLQLAEGRYRGRNGGGGTRGSYGSQLAAIALLVITQADGRELLIPTDIAWEGGYGILTADPKAGVHVDTRLSGADWTSVGDTDWKSSAIVRTVRHSAAVVAAAAEPVREVAQLRTPSVTEVDELLVIDVGQNIAGVLRIIVSGVSGQEIRVNHSELLAADGRIDREYLNQAGMDFTRAVDRFILNGDERQILIPSFTTRGFRYAEIEGLGRDQLHAVTAHVLSADLEYHGAFDSSHAGLNRLHENVVWSMRGNFTDAPTDCPTRERSGWTGDAQVFASTATFLADVRNYYADWLRDVALQQDADGAVGDIVPRDVELAGHPMSQLVPLRGSSGWGDAITIIPWTLHQAYGRTDVLAEFWDPMVKWVEYCRRRAENNRHPDRTGDPQPHEKHVVDTGFHWGDVHEADNEPEDDSPEAMYRMTTRLSTHPDAEIATAYFAHSTHILAQTAVLLGKQTDAERYDSLWQDVRGAYQREFLGDDGVPITDRQGKLARPLAFDLLPTSARHEAATRLAHLVRTRGNHVGTGFLSTGQLLSVLSGGGYDDVALDLLLQEEEPSWLAEVKDGATTIWESFLGIGSQNHYSLGGVASWCYENLAGLRRTAPGWTTATIAPVLNPRLTRVSGSTMTPFGHLACCYELVDGQWRVEVSVPPGIRAQLMLAGQGPRVLSPGVSTWWAPVA